MIYKVDDDVHARSLFYENFIRSLIDKGIITVEYYRNALNAEREKEIGKEQFVIDEFIEKLEEKFI